MAPPMEPPMEPPMAPRMAPPMAPRMAPRMAPSPPGGEHRVSVPSIRRRGNHLSFQGTVLPPSFHAIRRTS